MKNSVYFLVAAVVLLTACNMSSSKTQPELTLVFEDETYQLTGVAIGDKGRLFTNYPLWSDKYKFALTEVTGLQKANPYPDSALNNWKQGQDGKNKWVCVQAVYIDDRKTMWVVDPAAPRMAEVYEKSHKLVKINMNTNAVERIYPFEGVASDTSYINDVRVDTEKQFAYLTNSKEGGILIVDLKTGTTRQVLSKHYSVRSDPAFKFIIDGKELTKDGKVVKIHSDGIALTPDGTWLYYKPLTDDKLYRIKTEDLRNTALTATELATKVEDLGHFRTSDGMIFDKKGNLYLGDLLNSSIVRISPDLKMTTVVQDERLIWPDSYSISDDGYLYISCSQINKQPEYNGGVNKRTSPYAIFKLKL